MTASKSEQIHAIEQFIEWLPVVTSICSFTNDGGGFNEDPAELVAKFATEVLTECDTAIAHGPGHQSISVCIVTGSHTEHASDMGHEWHDKDIGTQTYEKFNYDGPKRDDGRRTKGSSRTYRLAFEPY